MPNTLKESTQRKKVVKAWIVVFYKGNGKFHRFLTSDVCTTKTIAENYLKKNTDFYSEERAKSKIIPCFITYNISK